VLGQSDEAVEYRPEVKPKTTWRQDEKGLEITAYRAQRLYTDRRWPNPLVLKITNVEPAMKPPETVTDGAAWNAATGTATLRARLIDLGNAGQVDAGFQYRERRDGTDLSEKTEPWSDLPGVARTAPGEFTYALKGLAANRPYEFRARVRHPLITIYGREKTFRTAP
jgi:alpha-L-fucosidase